MSFESRALRRGAQLVVISFWRQLLKKAIITLTILFIFDHAAFAAEFTCPSGLTLVTANVPHPWFDDIAVPSKWCIDKNGKKNGPWWGWEPKTNTLLFQVNTSNGKPDGRYQMFYTNGRIAEEGEIKQGSKTGWWITYNSDGSIRSKKQY
jgi:hypothetical protein